MFGEFFNSETLAQVIDRKADLELIQHLQDKKANWKYVIKMENDLGDINTKLR